MESQSNPVFIVSIIAICYFSATRHNFADFIKTIKSINTVNGTKTYVSRVKN